MPKIPLTEEIAVDALRKFFREKPFLFFGSGMSCAMDPRFGMGELKNALVGEIRARSLPKTQQDEWTKVDLALNSGSDLESALNFVSDRELLKTITDITGKFIATIDREQGFLIGKGDSEWPATHFLKRLVDTLPGGDRILHALTPNYDMIFEYSCDYAGIPYTNGFSGGVTRQIDWDAVDCSLRSRERITYGRKLTAVCKHKKHVRLYKVHGSLNYFLHRNLVIENNAWMWDPPDFVQRVMITPGLSKYERLQRYRQELLRSADTAIDKANHFLFIGYGFNDNHIEEYIKRKLIAQGCNGLIITRDSNPRIESLLREAPNLWLVCKSGASSPEGTRIFNMQYADWLILPGKGYWDIAEFTKQIIGG